MQDTVANLLVRYLERRGIRHLFGLCGHTNIAVLSAMDGSKVATSSSYPAATRATGVSTPVAAMTRCWRLGAATIRSQRAAGAI